MCANPETQGSIGSIVGGQGGAKSRYSSGVQKGLGDELADKNTPWWAKILNIAGRSGGGGIV